MDLDLAIKHNSKALKAIIEVLFALLGLDGADAASRIPRSLHSAALSVLRPAESAVRRLIVLAARGVVVKLAPSRPMAVGKVIGKGRGNSLPSFQLFDPRKRVKPARAMKVTRLRPRIHVFPYDSLRPAPRLWSNPHRRPMASSAPRASPAGSWRSSRRLMICRARPNVSCAGSRGGWQHHGQNSCRRSGRAVLPATAGSPFTRSMKCSSNATGSPKTRC